MKDNKEIRVFTSQCEVRKDDESEDYRVSGYAALFDHESRDLGFRETISRSAFDGRLEDNVILTYNHDMNAILDRNQGGTLKLSVDERGLRYDGTLPNTSTGNDVAELMRRGLLYESSFAFTVEDDGLFPLYSPGDLVAGVKYFAKDIRKMINLNRGFNQ